MSHSRDQRTKRHRDSGLPGSSFTGKTGTTGAYDPQFEQLLIDNGVYSDGHEDSNGEVPEPDNILIIRERLARSRSSLSPSHFDEATFKQFQRTNRLATSEQDVIRNVIPAIAGSGDGQYYNSGNIKFGNLAKSDPNLCAPKVDGYDGARPIKIEKRVRNDLNGYVIPSTSDHLPAVANHLTEVKGQSGRSDVLKRQATYAGGVGARSMFYLQNYGDQSPVYDGNAYTMVSTYHAGEGSLRMYATHPSQSATDQTEYHSTHVDSYTMTGNINSFRQGATAWRNSNDLAKEQRNSFIQSVNTTARRLPAVETPSSGSGSRMTASSANIGASFESDTSAGELAPEDEQPSKRHRNRMSTTSVQSLRNPDGRGREVQRLSDTTASSTKPPPPPSSHNWLGYLFKPTADGTFEFQCIIDRRTHVMTAKWVPGQPCPRVFHSRWKRWLQASLEGENLRILPRANWITLEKLARLLVLQT